MINDRPLVDVFDDVRHVLHELFPPRSTELVQLVPHLRWHLELLRREVGP